MMGSLVLISVFSVEISMFSLEGTVSGITSSPLCTDSDLSCHYNDIINVFIWYLSTRHVIWETNRIYDTTNAFKY